MTRHKARRRQRAMAARQALRLCEAEVFTLTSSSASARQRTAHVRPHRPRLSTARTRAALLAAGLPPHLAAALRHRLQLLPEQEDQQ